MRFLLDLLRQHQVLGAAVIVFGCVIISSLFGRKSPPNHIPLINPPQWFEPTTTRVKLAFALNARKWLTKGVQTGRPFRLLTDIGELIILPSKYAREIRADPRLDFAAVINKTFHAKFPGFEGFREGTPDAHRTRDVVRRHLTRCSDEMIASLAQECDTALHDVLSESPDWHEINVRDHVLQIIARLSSHVFLGDKGARDDAWLKITMEYTTNAYIAAMLLRMWPESLRPLVHWVLPQCRMLRRQVAEARQIVAGIISRRRKDKAAADAQGRPQPVFNDVIEWFSQAELEDSSSRCDPVIGQLILMQAAIHTTTDLLTQAMVDISLHPDVMEALRREVVQVVHKHGWSNATLSEMRLVESAVKESQRLKPIARTSMHRLVLDDMELSDGTRIPKGSVIGVSVDQMWNEAIHESPEVWNPHRFYRMTMSSSNSTTQAQTGGDDRDNGSGSGSGIGMDKDKEKEASLTSSSPNHLAWGYGKNACAGRFFVAQEVKVALAHLLRDYEWKMAPASVGTKPLEIGLTLAADPIAKILVRKV